MFLVTGDSSPKFSVFVQVRCPAHAKAGKNSVALIGEFALRVVIVVALTFGHQLQTTAAFRSNLLHPVSTPRSEKGNDANDHGARNPGIVRLGVLFYQHGIVTEPVVIEITLNHFGMRIWSAVLLRDLTVFVADVQKSPVGVLIEENFDRRRQFRWLITMKDRVDGAVRPEVERGSLREKARRFQSERVNLCACCA